PRGGRRVEPRGAGGQVLLDTDPAPPVPYFSWFVGPILRSASRRARSWVERALRAADAGRPPPPAPKRPSLAPPTAFSAPQAVLLATVCALTAAATYGSSLLSQNVDYVGRSFGASDRALGTALAISRAGVLIALVASAMADRRGRRMLMLVSFGGVCVANGVARPPPPELRPPVGRDQALRRPRRPGHQAGPARRGLRPLLRRSLRRAGHRQLPVRHLHRSVVPVHQPLPGRRPGVLGARHHG